MTVLVTGGAGFIGSHVVDALVGRGERVVVVDDLETPGHRNERCDFIGWSVDDFCDAWGDLNSRKHFRNPDVVIHLAANPSVNYSTVNPVFDAESNILETVRLLEWCASHNVKHFIFASTCAVYGNADSPATEDTPTNPISPYGISKLAAERYVEYYSRTYGMPATILRFSNVYGPRQRPEAGVVAAFCDKMLRGEPVTIYGDGSAVRDYLYVDDAVAAVLAAMDRDVRYASDVVFNVGSGWGTKTNWLAIEASCSAWKSGSGVYSRRAENRPGDVQRIILNCEKAADALGWRPQVKLQVGLRRTVEWHTQRQLAPA